MVEQIVNHRATLCYLDIPLGVVNGNDASRLFGDNLSVVNSTVTKGSKCPPQPDEITHKVLLEFELGSAFAPDSASWQLGWGVVCTTGGNTLMEWMEATATVSVQQSCTVQEDDNLC